METDTYLKLTDHQGETVHLLLSHLGGGKHALSTSVGSGTSTVIPPGGGDPVNLDEEPLVVTLNDGTAVPGGMTVGGNSSAPAEENSQIDWYGSIVRGGVAAMSDAEIALCRLWCATRAGVTL